MFFEGIVLLKRHCLFFLDLIIYFAEEGQFSLWQKTIQEVR